MIRRPHQRKKINALWTARNELHLRETPPREPQGGGEHTEYAGHLPQPKTVNLLGPPPPPRCG